jgi:hypothetical protein
LLSARRFFSNSIIDLLSLCSSLALLANVFSDEESLLFWLVDWSRRELIFSFVLVLHDGTVVLYS